MEFASKLRWFLVIVAVVLFLVLVGWGLYSIARNIFDSGSGGSSSSQVASDVDSTVEFANTVRYYHDGPIVANQDHRSFSIDVSSSVVTMKVYKSYGQVVIREKSYKNTDDAYNAFLLALDNIGVPDRIEGTTVEDDNADTGVCPSGRRYVVEIDSSIRRWSSSCSSGQGTAGFSMSATRNLFQRQVPDYSDLVSGERL